MGDTQFLLLAVLVILGISGLTKFLGTLVKEAEKRKDSKETKDIIINSIIAVLIIGVIVGVIFWGMEIYADYEYAVLENTLQEIMDRPDDYYTK